MFVSGPHLKGLSWQTPTQTDSSKSGPKLPPSSQINGGRMSSPRAQWQDRRCGNGACLMDRDVHPSSPLARPPLHLPSFVFVTACFLLCAATGRPFVKVTASVRSLCCWKSSDTGSSHVWYLQSVTAKKAFIQSINAFFKKFKPMLTDGCFWKWKVKYFFEIEFQTRAETFYLFFFLICY